MLCSVTSDLGLLFAYVPKWDARHQWAATWQNQQNDLCAQRTQIRLGGCPESSLSAWRKLGSLATHWAHSEDSDQTGQMPRLIWIFPGRTLILLVLSWGVSNWLKFKIKMKWCQNCCRKFYTELILFVRKNNTVYYTTIILHNQTGRSG